MAGIELRADADPNVTSATVWLDGVASGLAPTALQAPPGRHLIELTEPDFETLAPWIEVRAGEVVPLVPMREVATASRGSLLVEADVPDAEVSNRRQAHPGHDAGDHPRPARGPARRRGAKPGATPWKQTVQITADQRARVRAELAAHTGGAIRVLADAPGAHAWLDGTDMGAGAVDIKDVRPDVHLVPSSGPPGRRTTEKRVTGDRRPGAGRHVRARVADRERNAQGGLA